MFLTIVLFIGCALLAFAAVPLIMRIVPPNPFYGINTSNTAKDNEIWLVVNAFLGWAVLAAAGLMAIALAFYSGTWWLKSWWMQLLLFLILVGGAIGATLWFERRMK
jgi:hypothetical protein